jgi:membrane protein
LVTLGIIVFTLLTLAAMVALPVVLSYIALPGVTGFLVKAGRWPVLFLLVTHTIKKNGEFFWNL